LQADAGQTALAAARKWRAARYFIASAGLMKVLSTNAA